MSIDTVSDLPPRVQYVASAAQTLFPYPFPIFEDGDLVVDRDGTTASLDVDYTVSGEGDDLGGDVTWIGAAFVGGEIVTIYRDIAIERDTDISQNGQWLSSAYNDEQDKIFLILQQVKAQLARSLRLPIIAEVADADIELDPALFANMYLAFDPDGKPIPAAFVAGTITAAIVGQILFPTSAAETSTLAVITNFGRPEGDVRRYGILPNNIAFAAANTAALRTLLDPTKTGPRGNVYFPVVTGDDTYHFNNFIEVRDYVTIDLCGNRLLWTKNAAAADQTMGFLTVKTGVTVMNGTLEANITGTVGGNACLLYRIGSRTGYRWGPYTTGIFDKVLADGGLAPQGACRMINMKFKSNNPYANASPIGLGLGGIRDVVHDNCFFEGSGAGGPGTGFYYEMGDATDNGFPSTPAKWGTSHAINLYFRNIRGKNLNTVAVSSDDAVLSLTEPNDFIIDGIYGESVNGLVASRVGEGHYHNAWAPDQTSGPRLGVIRGARGTSIVSSGINVNGSSASGGQFSDANMIAAGLPVLTLQEKLDLLQFEISDFDFKINAATGYGILANAPVTIRRGASRGGAIFLQADCSQFSIDEVNIFDVIGQGIRADTDSTLLPGRKKRGSITNSKICGGTAQALSLDYVDGVVVENNQIGYILAKGDAADEAVQTIGVAVSSNGRNVLCRNNNIKTSGGALAYSMASVSGGEESGGNAIINPIGTVTYAGKWRGVVQTVNLSISAAVPGNLAVAYTQRTLSYIRSIAGDFVDYTINLLTSSYTHTTASGALVITGLPYATANNSSLRSPVAPHFGGLTKAGYTQFLVTTNDNDTTMGMVACGTGIAAAGVNITDFPTGGTVVLRASGRYFV